MVLDEAFKSGAFRIWRACSKRYDTIYFYGDEGEWTLNPEISKYIFENMPCDLSATETGLYIYYKMCEAFSYDVNYLYRKMDRSFRKERLEKIKLDSPIVCWDFARIYSKLIDMSGVKKCFGVVLDSEENDEYFFSDHLGVGLLTVDGIIEFEPMTIDMNENRLSDLTSAKAHFPLTNIFQRCGDKETLEQSIAKLNNYFGYFNSADDYLCKLMEKEEIKDSDLLSKMYFFMECMKAKGIKSQELIYMFSFLNRNGFFGENLDHTFVGEVISNNCGIRSFKDDILIKNYYDNSILVDTMDYSCCVYSDEQIDEMFLTHKIATIYHQNALQKFKSKK